MTHLGSWVSALADGQLSPSACERALAHVATCAPCAEELAAARAARRTLASAHDVAPAPDLTARLLALSAQIPPADADPLRRRPTTSDPLAPAPARLEHVDGTLSGALTGHGRRRARRLGAFAVGGAGVVAFTLFALGDSPVITPGRHLAEPLTLLAQAGPDELAAGQGPAPHVVLAGDGARRAAGPAGADGVEAATLAWMSEHGWEQPGAVPQGFTVSAVRLVGPEAEVLEVDLRGPRGSIVLREQAGRLDTTALEDLTTVDVDGRTVYVISDEPWHVVWQAGDTVIDVVADTDADVVTSFVATFPARDYDAGVPARIVRGWTTMTGALGTS